MKRICEPPTEYESASVSQRVCAECLDLFCVFFLAAMILALAPSLGELGFLANLTATLGAIAYRILGDGLMDGARIGKRMVGIYVVDAESRGPCSVAQSAIRNGFLIIRLALFIELIILVCDGQQRGGAIKPPKHMCCAAIRKLHQNHPLHALSI